MNTKNILLSLLLMVTSFASWAQSYRYDAEVKGMVCAFCAYSVSKNVSQLPGVDADSVDVDLKGGHVTFNSRKKVSEEKLSGLFTDSGFSISHLTMSETSKKPAGPTKQASLDLQLDVFKIDQLSSVIEAIGNIAASNPSRLVINAPLAQEETILKPLLMGRQQVIKVRFIPTQAETMRLRLFDIPVNSES
jgi:copper chaperone CopZ